MVLYDYENTEDSVTLQGVKILNQPVFIMEPLRVVLSFAVGSAVIGSTLVYIGDLV